MQQIIYCIDTETTGLDPLLNDVIEVSFWRMTDDDQKTWLIRALNEEHITEKALKINGHNRDDIMVRTAIGKQNYRDPADVVSEIESWIISDGSSVEDRVFLGQNPAFDYDFLKQLWVKAGSPDTFPFGRTMIDTIQLVRLIDYCSGKKRDKYNLSSLIKDFGVTKQKAHRAAEDVKMTKDLFLKIIEPIKTHISESFKYSYGEKSETSA